MEENQLYRKRDETLFTNAESRSRVVSSLNRTMAVYECRSALSVRLLPHTDGKRGQHTGFPLPESSNAVA
jgi:hypothetical protein